MTVSFRSRHYIFILIVFTPAALPEPVGAICAYNVSSQYGAIPRYIYYALLVVSIGFHRAEWLVNVTLSTAMLFSSVTAVHGIILAAVSGQGAVDLDIFPVFAVAALGMIVAPLMFVWSKALREAPMPAKAVVYIWVLLMCAGVAASVYSIGALPTPQYCEQGPAQSNCLNYNIIIPMRKGQSASAVPWGDHTLPILCPVYTGVRILLVLLCLVCVCIWESKGGLLVLRISSNNRSSRHFGLSTDISCVKVISFLYGGVVMAEIVLTEYLLLGPHQLPLEENITAIGQWGPLPGAVFVIVGSLVKWRLATLANRRPDLESAVPETEETRRTSQNDTN